MKKVLVIDDSPLIRRLVRSTLDAKEFECEDATNGRDAFTKITENQYDLIISDLNMPGLNGLELLKEIRTKLPQVTTPVIMLTTESNLESIKVAKEFGVAGWIIKPFTSVILIKTVSRLVNGAPPEKK